jgi:hypothetical protein
VVGALLDSTETIKRANLLFRTRGSGVLRLRPARDRNSEPERLETYVGMPCERSHSEKLCHSELNGRAGARPKIVNKADEFGLCPLARKVRM